ncbi:MAG: hypothetical protein HY899_06890 [Deltaproteobacteria bacterium]|nr:hypothetical protein [Deltaproteobacteria bacterium]
MNQPRNASGLFAMAFMAMTLLLGPITPGLARDADTEEVAKARERIAEVAKEMIKNAEAVKKDLGSDEVAEDDVALDLMRYATFRTAGTFFSTWSADKKLTRPDRPKCFLEDGAAETSLATQIANDEFLISFVQEGHLYEVAAGIAEQICQTFGPQIVRPLIRQAEEGLPAGMEPATPVATK